MVRLMRPYVAVEGTERGGQEAGQWQGESLLRPSGVRTSSRSDGEPLGRRQEPRSRRLPCLARDKKRLGLS